MIKNFKLKKNIDCFNMALLVSSKYYGLESRKIFVGNYYFNYKKEKCDLFNEATCLEVVSNNIIIWDKNKLTIGDIDLLPRCFDKNTKIMIEQITQILDRSLILIITTDTYNLDWCQYYKKKHNLHLITVIGYDNNSLIGEDPFFTDKLVRISTKVVKQAFFIVQPVEKCHERYDYSQELLFNMNKYQNEFLKCSEKKTNEFISDLICFDTSGASKNVVQDMYLLLRLKAIENNRICYLELLNEVDMRRFEEPIGLIKNSITSWVEFRVILTKALFKSNVESKSEILKEKMKKICANDKQIASLMQREINTKQRIL